ncbi:MAG: tRNA lysidine(34) synthetase TilS [Paracoccaceae bacterium]|nr:tRNA lysidine(34) synthetase TilS [Paracoccaceae bacterium]
MTDRFAGLRDRAADFGIDRGKTVGVAVSGGSDSLAMLLLLHEQGWPIEVATVDHGLRPEASEEAAFVAGLCAERGIRHETLHVDLSEVKGNLQDQARRARYGALRDWAGRQGIRHVALGHTLDDQAETFLMRLARGAGIDGLTAMEERFGRDSVVFLRPFIGFRRAELQAYLRDKNIAWIDDPTNEDERFDRVKARRILGALEPLGVTVDSLAMTMSNLGAARLALVGLAEEMARKAFRDDRGDVVFDRDCVLGTSLETMRRLLVGAIIYLSGSDYPPRRETVNELWDALLDRRNITLGGCFFSHEGGDTRVTREYNAVKKLRGPTDQLWDGRWQLDGPHAADLDLRALGEAVKDTPWRETGMPRASLMASPAVWRGETLVAAPVAGVSNGWTAKTTGRGNFADFLICR